MAECAGELLELSNAHGLALHEIDVEDAFLAGDVLAHGLGDQTRREVLGRVRPREPAFGRDDLSLDVWSKSNK